MELLQLKYFCDAAVSENFSSTAKKYGVPQSDISQSVRRLERELGINLFSRRANRISLNEKGREFYEKVFPALEMISDAADMARDGADGGKIKLCINTNRRIVMQALEKYRRMYPGVEIVTTHFTEPGVSDFDIIIDTYSPRFSEYQKHLLISEKIMLAVKSGSKHAGTKHINVAELSDEPFITMSEKSSMYDITESICRDFGFKPKIAMQSDDPFYVRKGVELGLGVSFVPEFSWKGLFSDEVELIEVEGYMRDTYVFTTNRKYAPQCVRNFLDVLLDEVK